MQRIAIFTIKNVYAGWYSAGAYAEALRRMGHKVLECPLPGNQVQNLDEVKNTVPAISELNRCDLVMSLMHEYVQPWLAAIYGLNEWKRLKVPVVAKMEESMDRTDLGLPVRVPELMEWADHVAFPGAQDAKKYGGAWVTYGCDTQMFNPTGRAEPIHDLAFIGQQYKLRLDYIQKLSVHLDNSFTFKWAPCFVQDLSGIREPESTHLLADNYRKIKVFFCLPPLSRLLVGKVFDVMACGTFLMYPRWPGEQSENMEVFEDGHHLVYYDFGYFLKNAEQIKYWLSHDAEREAVARAGCRKVREDHTIEKMLEKLLALAGKSSSGIVLTDKVLA